MIENLTDDSQPTERVKRHRDQVAAIVAHAQMSPVVMIFSRGVAQDLNQLWSHERLSNQQWSQE